MNSDSFLPIDFINRMESDLGADFHAFLRSYDEDKISALRLNPIKARENSVDELKEFITGPVEWCGTGFYYDDNTRPGLHPYHLAGVYYIQDASAMLPAEMLGVEPGDFVLDLCAAPGGKSTQLAGKLMGRGLLVSNEPMKARAKILSENIERLGIRNALVVSEYPDKLAGRFQTTFDKILVDAPCSGEGMFRKNHDACKEWSLESVKMCAERQAEILDNAYEMLLPGGRLCYSTCTFSRAEDEDTIKAFCDRHPDMMLVREERLWPHKIKGEGHYAALLEKADSDNIGNELSSERNTISLKPVSKQILKDYLTFEKEALSVSFSSNLFLNDDQLYLLPEGTLDFSKLHVLRAGLNLGTFKKNRFEPSHALALALNENEVKTRINLKADSPEIKAYLTGQTLCYDVPDGWTLIQCDGYSIGWGKAVNGQIKNHFPKGLRLYI